MKEKILDNYTVENINDFEDATAYFLNDKLKEERLKLYEEIKNQYKLESLAEAKHHILKQVFSNYIFNSLNKANIAHEEGRTFEAKKYIDNLLKLRNVFKNHDVLNYKEFIAESEPEISDIEVNILFVEPTLNKEELNRLNQAFITAFGKKKTVIDNKVQFQQAFYNHPLINCLGAYNDYSQITNKVEEGVLKLGKYQQLIETILKLRKDMGNEAYQGLIFYVIKEDLTVGLKNILDLKDYQPKYLQDLLKCVVKGEGITDKIISKLAEEIKNDHSINVAIDKNKQLIQNKSSQFSLNDSGFYLKFKNDERQTFWHAHESKTGVNQKEQQANTAHINRANGYDTFGATITDDVVTRSQHHMTFMRERGLAEKSNLSVYGEVFLSGLHLDAASFKAISTEYNTIEDYKNNDFIMSNNYIVKSHIEKCVELINLCNGKNDLELLMNKKEVYCDFIKQNQELFKFSLEITSTENEMVYQLIAKPLLTFIESLLNIEEDINIEIFTSDDISILKNVMSASALNIDIKKDLKTINKKIEKRNTVSLDKIESFKNPLLEFLNSKSHIISQLEYTNETQANKYSKYSKELSKMINNGNVSIKYLNEVLSNVDFKNDNVSKQGKTALHKNSMKAINYISNSVLPNNKPKKLWLLEGINFILHEIKLGNDIKFNKIGYIPKYFDNDEVFVKTTFSTLLNENRTEVVNLILNYARANGTKIICDNIPEDTLKVKI